MRYGFSLVTLLLTVMLSTAAGLTAELGGREEKDGPEPAGAAQDWNSQLSILHLPSSDLKSRAGDVGITDYRAKISRNLKLDTDLTLTLGVGYGLKQIDASIGTSLPRDLHALFLEAGASYRINDKAFATLKLIPGFYSDFKDLGTADLRMPVLALGWYGFENGLSVVGGFLYRFGYHSNAFIPALGFSYQPNQSWRIDMIAPRPGITYFASPRLQLFVAGDFASEEYQLNDRSLGAKAIRYADYKAMGGLNYLPDPAIKLSTSVGYAFERRFAFYDSAHPDLRIDDVPFFKLSLDLGW